jgi:hypothetical protein
MAMITVTQQEPKYVEMLDKIGKDLAIAKTPAEFLDARTRANFVDGIAKDRVRLAKREIKKEPKFREYFDEIIRAAYQASTDALFMKRQAEIGLAKDYDNGVAEGKYAKPGQTKSTGTSGKPKPFLPGTASGKQKPEFQNELGIEKKDMHQYRKAKAVEQALPGVVESVVRENTAKGIEPTTAEIRRIENELYKENKATIQAKEKAEKAAQHKKIDDADLHPMVKDALKGMPIKSNIDTFARELTNRLEKEKIKLEEIIYYSESLSIYMRRVQLPQVLGEMGDFFLECAKILKNQEHVPNMNALKVVNPENQERE